MGAEAEGRMQLPTYARSLIDTDILIDASKFREDASAFLAEQQVDGIQISIISATEQKVRRL